MHNVDDEQYYSSDQLAEHDWLATLISALWSADGDVRFICLLWILFGVFLYGKVTDILKFWFNLWYKVIKNECPKLLCLE